MHYNPGFFCSYANEGLMKKEIQYMCATTAVDSSGKAGTEKSNYVLNQFRLYQLFRFYSGLSVCFTFQEMICTKCS